jgi:hypothetical protein
MRWEKALPSETNALRKAARLIGQHWIHILRSALFLASVLVILDHLYVLEWLDVFILRVLHRGALNTATVDRVEPPQALVFTIGQELFETEFKSRSPIDRSVLQRYLEQLESIYPNFKVLAIDYDLSPNNDDPAEQETQAEFDAFLLSLSEVKQKKVVLIQHLPVKNRALCERKIAWQKEMYDKGILFGDPELLQYGTFGPVVKYVERQDSFPATVLAAMNDRGILGMRFTCDELEPWSREPLGHKKVQPINFAQAVAEGSVKVCELRNLTEFQNCKIVFGEQIDAVEVIFFGGNYGKDDTYLTPLSETPGVTVQAYTYFSMVQPLEQKHWQAWIIDIVAGFLAGIIFHMNWAMFHHYRQQGKFSPQVAMASLNFIILIGFLVAPVLLIARALTAGIWINPTPMFIGLYIDNYVAAVTATGEGVGHGSHAMDGFTAFFHKLFGIPGQNVSGWELFFHGALKITVFWITVGIALCIL